MNVKTNMKFEIGSKVRRKSDGLIGTISRVIAIEGYEYGVDFYVAELLCKEDELELVEETEEEKHMNVKTNMNIKTNMKMRGKLWMMLKCERCGAEEFAESTSDLETTELIEDLEFDSDVMDRWGEINGLSLCPKCAGIWNTVVDGFMRGSGNVQVNYYDGHTETV